jgi:hypothetical protein
MSGQPATNILSDTFGKVTRRSPRQDADLDEYLPQEVGLRVEMPMLSRPSLSFSRDAIR